MCDMRERIWMNRYHSKKASASGMTADGQEKTFIYWQSLLCLNQLLLLVSIVWNTMKNLLKAEMHSDSLFLHLRLKKSTYHPLLKTCYILQCLCIYINIQICKVFLLSQLLLTGSISSFKQNMAKCIWN